MDFCGASIAFDQGSMESLYTKNKGFWQNLFCGFIMALALMGGTCDPTGDQTNGWISLLFGTCVLVINGSLCTEYKGNWQNFFCGLLIINALLCTTFFRFEGEPVDGFSWCQNSI